MSIGHGPHVDQPLGHGHRVVNVYRTQELYKSYAKAPPSHHRRRLYIDIHKPILRDGAAATMSGYMYRLGGRCYA